MISSSDWIYIICTFCIIATALTAPYLNDLWKRKSLAPKLKIIFYRESAFIVSFDREDSFSIFFEVKNSGNSEVKNCISIIEEFCYEAEDRNFIKNDKYFPAKLLPSENLPIINILPKTSHFFKLFIFYKNDQNKIGSRIEMVPLIEYTPSAEYLEVPFTHLKIKIAIYSENAKKCVQQIEINSPGIWREDIKQILQEIQITSS